MTAINVSSLGSSLTGSTFDWQSFVDRIIELDSAPITKLQNEQATNIDKVTSLDYVKTSLTELQTASKALNASGLFTGRTATSSVTGSTWALTAASGATSGSYAIAISQLATVSKRVGASNIGAAISTTNDVSGVTLATLPTSIAATAGTFTLNGAQVTVALTDSLQSVFAKISAATGGAVTATYDSATDKVSLNSASEIVLGSATDSSNLLSALQLFNNGTGTIASSNSIGTVNTKATLANARLSQTITAVDGSGNGTFALNGVSIAYNINTDSLNDVITRINNSAAGVTASYDTASDRMVLTNTITGDVGFGLSETAGGLLGSLGISMSTVGATTTRGKNAQFTINGGATISSTSNTLSSAVTGITGLTVQATTDGTQTITIASNTTAMRSAIQTFIEKYNSVQSFIDTQTSVSVKNGIVNASVLSNTREVENWAHVLRGKAFSAVSGLSGTISRLADLGIDFTGTGNQLLIRDSSKLDNALANNPTDVAAFFNTTSTGFAAKMDGYLTTLLDSSGTGTNGAITALVNNLTSQNVGIDRQIAQIQRQLDSEKERMTISFQAMQIAQSNAKSMMDVLKNAFSNTNNSNNN
ncbi:MAG: flagellar filament capping protein FliD [Verrucomicrobia bacterium]|nr:flagellar filament capping protein FliD [Verrucomicrobiota bacterium]